MTKTIETQRRVCLDLFAGTGSSTRAFADDSLWRVVTVEFDHRHPNIDLYADILTLTAQNLLDACGGERPSFIWASPPCTGFSVASIGTHWGGGHRAYEPKTETARRGIALVEHTLRLIQDLNPAHWVMENPRGVLRKLPVVAGLPRVGVTYCQYGDERMKPTDLWGKFPTQWTPRPMCRTGDRCHVAAPRGAKTGTQGRSGSVDRSRIPYQLGRDLKEAIRNDRQ